MVKGACFHHPSSTCGLLCFLDTASWVVVCTVYSLWWHGKEILECCLHCSVPGYHQGPLVNPAHIKKVLMVKINGGLTFINQCQSVKFSKFSFTYKQTKTFNVLTLCCVQASMLLWHAKISQPSLQWFLLFWKPLEGKSQIDALLFNNTV